MTNLPSGFRAPLTRGAPHQTESDEENVVSPKPKGKETNTTVHNKINLITLKVTLEKKWIGVMITPSDCPEKQREFRLGTEYWDSLLEKYTYDYLEVYPGIPFLQSCRDWTRFRIVSITKRVTPCGPDGIPYFRVGPYSNNESMIIDTPHYWDFELGGIVCRHSNSLPPSITCPEKKLINKS